MLFDDGGQSFRLCPITMEPRQGHLGGKDRLPDTFATGKRAEQAVKRLVGMKETGCVVGGNHSFLLGDDVAHRTAHFFRPLRRDFAQQSHFE
ncbi:hypothetical protein D3C87_1250570 [compost metagenome]